VSSSIASTSQLHFVAFCFARGSNGSVSCVPGQVVSVSLYPPRGVCHPTIHLSIHLPNHPTIRSFILVPPLVSFYKLSRFNCDIRQTFKIRRILSWSLCSDESLPSTLILPPGTCWSCHYVCLQSRDFCCLLFPVCWFPLLFPPTASAAHEIGIRSFCFGSGPFASGVFSALNWNKSVRRITPVFCGLAVFSLISKVPSRLILIHQILHIFQ